MKAGLGRRIEYGFKKWVTGVVFFFLWRAFRALFRADTRVHDEMAAWPEGLVLHMQGGKSGPHLYLQRTPDGIRRLKRCDKPTVDIQFKSLDCAFKLVTGRLGVAQAYAEHRFTLAGDIAYTMSFVRCVNITEAYLFPKFITRHILLEIPQKQHGSLSIYRRVVFGH